METPTLWPDLLAALADQKRAVDKSTLTIRGAEVIAKSPEGQTASMPLDAFLAKLAGHRIDTGGVVLPDGIKASITEGAVTIWVYECPPRVQRFLWIAPDSPVPFGPGTKYRPVRLALPYLIMLVVFAWRFGGLSGYGLVRTTLKVTLASVVVAALSYGGLVLMSLAPLRGGFVLTRALMVAVSAALGVVGYLAVGRLLHIEDLAMLVSLVRRRLFDR